MARREAVDTTARPAPAPPVAVAEHVPSASARHDRRVLGGGKLNLLPAQGVNDHPR